MAKNVQSRSAAARRGLTLLELVVVLVILIGLAGILVPMLPSMLGRTETASGATNHVEIGKWIQTYEQLYQGYPKDWDALTDGTVKIAYVRGGGGVALDTTGLSADEAAALTACGITRLQKMVDGTSGSSATPPANKTFDPYDNDDYAANGLAPAAGVKLVVLTDAGKKSLNLSDGTANSGKYVVFGFGKRA